MSKNRQQKINSYFAARNPQVPSTRPQNSQTPTLAPIRKYFTQVAHNQVTKQLSMRCNICAENSVFCKTITGKPYDNFNKHLKKNHPEKFKELEEEKQLISAQPATESDLPAVTLGAIVTRTQNHIFSNREKYFKGNPKQIEFEENLLDFVAEVGPLNVVDKPCFRKLCRGLDKSIWIPSRRTIGRMLLEKFDTKVKSSVITKLSALSNQELHITTDIWTSQGHFSVIGFKAQFISKNWKLENILLGFKHFPEAHTAENLGNKFKQFIFGELGVRPNQVGVITGNNASNILCAFKHAEYDVTFENHVEELSEVLEVVIDEEEEEEDDVIDVDILEFEEPQELLNTEDRESDVVIDLLDLATEIQITMEEIVSREEEPDESILLSMAEQSSTRVPCMAHLLQLAIKDAINSNPTVKQLRTKLSGVIKYFHKATFWYNKLKEKGYPSLIKPCSTRWNSFYHCLKRVVESEGYIPAINQVLSEARKVARGRKAKQEIPATFRPIDLQNIRHFKDILSTLAQLSDDLQAEKVTSSLIILGVLDAYEYVDSYEITDGTVKELKEFQGKLLESIANRFSKNKVTEPVLEENGRRQNIFTINIFEQKHLILASILDPRLKKTPFEWNMKAHWQIKDKYCDILKARDVLETEYEFLLSELLFTNYDSDNDQPIILDPQPNAIPDQTDRPATKKCRSMFDAVEKRRAEADVKEMAQEVNVNEVEVYLRELPISIKNNPLEWWKENESKFPLLSKLARIYLGIPASNGSVERLFTVGGSIGRSRRAAMNVETMESVLCYMDMRRTRVDPIEDIGVE